MTMTISNTTTLHLLQCVVTHNDNYTNSELITVIIKSLTEILMTQYNMAFIGCISLLPKFQSILNPRITQ
jgi:hypothetical protein